MSASRAIMERLSTAKNPRELKTRYLPRPFLSLEWAEWSVSLWRMRIALIKGKTLQPQRIINGKITEYF
jgi:hypothetical protein